MFKTLCTFFLLCIGINNIEKLQNVTKAITLKYLDFTRLKGTFEEKIMFSYMVYNEKPNFSQLATILKTLDFTGFTSTFEEKICFSYMVYGETDFCPKIENRQNH